MEASVVAGTSRGSATMLRTILLACGVASSLLYVVMLVVAAMQYPGYSSMSRAVSELSAIGAPSRPLWVALGIVYGVLVIAFGWGIWREARANRALRIVGALFVVNGVIGFAWPPMHPRGAAFTTTDLLHVGFTVVTLVFMMLSIGFGAAAFGRRFRLYSIGTLLVHLGFGILTFTQGRSIAAGLETPWVGLTQRINIGVHLLWVAVLAVAVMRAGRSPVRARRVDAPTPLPPGATPVDARAIVTPSPTSSQAGVPRP